MPKTIEEIAAATGYSVTTVRFVIGGQAERYRISAATRRKVEEYVARHGYELNHAARSLKLQRSEAVGCVVPDLGNAFFARLTEALEGHCRGRGLVLLTASTHEDPEIEARAVESLLARGVDGLVIAPCRRPDLTWLARRRRRPAVVVVDRAFPQEVYPSVVSDNFDSSLRMSRQLLRESEGQAVFLCAQPELPSIQHRLRGFAEACGEMEISDWESRVLRLTDDSVESGGRLMQTLIARCAGVPRAFLCSSLLVLEGALEKLKTHYGTIPGTVLIATFDSHAMLDFIPNRVLSVRQDEAGIAARAFASLAEQMEGRSISIEHQVVPCQLISRN